MRARTPDGRTVVVARRWAPWRLRARDLEPGDERLDPAGGLGARGIVAGAVASLLVGVVLALAFTPQALALEALVLVLAVPALALPRLLGLVPWVVVARHDGLVLGSEPVRGWRASRDRIAAIAAAYERGNDPWPGPVV
jgi:hypothetical protein